MQKILLIGGPGSGKSTLLRALENRGFTCLPEISRQVIQEAQKSGIDQLFLEQPLLFSQLLLDGRIAQWKEADESKSAVFIDRGIPDVLAYMRFIGDTYPDDFDQACRDYRYDSIFMLPPWEAIYKQDNERYESFGQALEIHEHLLETYGHYGYEPLIVPVGTVGERVDFVLGRIEL